MRQTLALKVFVVLSLAALFSIRPAAAQYKIRDVGSLRTDGTGTSVANAINNNGNVVGTASTDSGEQHAFLTGPNMPINPATDDLRTFDMGSVSFGFGVNLDSSGGAQAVGQGNSPATPYMSLAFRGGPPIQALGPLQNGSDHIARSINSAGQTVGSATRTDNTRVAVSWDAVDGGITDLNTLLPAGSPWMLMGALAINDPGAIAGVGLNNGQTRAFLLNSGVTDLGILPGASYSVAYSINAGGTVVGDSGGTAFVWNSSTGMTGLGMLPGDNASVATCINSGGLIVGRSSPIPGAGPSKAVVFMGGMVIDLNMLIPPGSGWILLSAEGCNDSGQIVGAGILNGLPRGFVLTPC